MATPGERLRTARENAGFRSAREAAQMLGISISTYNSHERAGEPGARLFKIDAARLYARRFGVSAAWLLTGEGTATVAANEAPARVEVHAVAVRGIAQAGVWREYEDMDIDALDPVPTIPGRWRTFEQFAYRCIGPSMDKAGFQTGDYAICVNYFDARSDFQSEDVVVVERKNGQSIERTIKRLRVVQDGFELWPESSDPRFQQPIYVAAGKLDAEDGDNGVVIVGLVIGRWSPM
jgi:SOS-response transcriptional repressor LexA